MKLDEMLGFDADNPRDRHAEILVDEHENLMRSLVRYRKQHGISRQQVAESMGIDVSGVARIEAGDRDLHLSTLRRYAFACGVIVRHDVRSFESVWRAERAARMPDAFTSKATWAPVTKALMSVGSKR